MVQVNLLTAGDVQRARDRSRYALDSGPKKRAVRKYRQKHPYAVNERNRRYRAQDPEKLRGYERKQRDENFASYLFKRVKAAAIRQNLEFDLTLDWIRAGLSAGICSMTGLSFSYEKLNPFIPSVDRLDSNRGYTQDNCRFVCWLYNVAKNQWSDKDVLIVAQALVNKYGR